MKRIAAMLTLLLVPLFVLLGCGKKEPPQGAQGGPGPAGSAPAAPGKELNLFGWSEYVPQQVLDGFEKETGIKVNYETFGNNEEMVAKLVAGGTKYDLIQPSEYTIEALAKKKKLLPLDLSRIPNLKNLAPEFKNRAHDPELKYTIPYMGSIVGIVVNTDKVKEPIKGYKDVFQDRYKGRIVAVNDAREIVAWALAAEGLDANVMTPEVLSRVKPILAKWLKLVKVFDSDSPKTALLNGDVDIGLVWSGEAAILYEKDKKFQFVLASEGAHLAIDSLAIPVGSENKIGAEMFMNYILRPDVSKLISDKFPYTNPNAEARKLLSPAQLANPASYPPGFEKMQTFHDIGAATAEVDRMITDLKASN
jgi:spermidine/putrescine-binding protein